MKIRHQRIYSKEHYQCSYIYIHVCTFPQPPSLSRLLPFSLQFCVGLFRLWQLQAVKDGTYIFFCGEAHFRPVVELVALRLCYRKSSGVLGIYGKKKHHRTWSKLPSSTLFVIRSGFFTDRSLVVFHVSNPPLLSNRSMMFRIRSSCVIMTITRCNFSSTTRSWRFVGRRLWWR